MTGENGTIPFFFFLEYFRLGLARTHIATRGHCGGGTTSRLGGRGVVPREIRMIAEFSGLDQVRGGEDGAEDDADATDDDVGDSEEGVAAAHDAAGGNENGLGAAKLGHLEVCVVLVGER